MDVLDHITVPVADLLAQIRQMDDDGIEFVELSIAPPDTLDGETLPARLDLSGLMPDDPTGLVGYDSIDAADV